MSFLLKEKTVSQDHTHTKKSMMLIKKNNEIIKVDNNILRYSD